MSSLEGLAEKNYAMLPDHLKSGSSHGTFLPGSHQLYPASAPLKKAESSDAKPSITDALKELSPLDYLKMGASGIGSALISGATLAGGLLNVASMAGSYVLAEYLVKRSHNEKLSGEDVKNNSLLGSAMAPWLHTLLKHLKSVENPYLKTAAGVGIVVPLFNSLFWPARHIIYNYNPVSLAKKIFSRESLIREVYENSLKPNFVKSWKSIAKYLTLPFHFVWNYVPLEFQIPATSVTRTAYKYVMEKSASDNNKAYYPARASLLPA